MRIYADNAATTKMSRAEARRTIRRFFPQQKSERKTERSILFRLL